MKKIMIMKNNVIPNSAHHRDFPQLYATQSVCSTTATLTHVANSDRANQERISYTRTFTEGFAR